MVNSLNTTTFKTKREDFPQNFIFGTATSSYQIEGSRFGGCGLSHWDTFAATPGNVVRNEDGQNACNHYAYWQEDIALIKQAGLHAYRFSTSWPRLFPEKNKKNQAGFAFYDRIIDELLKLNIQPCLTLYHWDLPVWLAEIGGWQNRDIASYFAEFTEAVLKQYGDRVHMITPINEPWCVAWLSHYYGYHAPGLRDNRAAALAMHHVLLAHGRAVQVLRSNKEIKIGFNTNHEFVEAANATAEAKQAAAIYDAVYNYWFLDAVYKQQYPTLVLQGLEHYLPNNYQDDFAIIGEKVDWHGVNYYTRKLIAPGESKNYFDCKEVTGSLEKTAMEWEVYPRGLHFHLKNIQEKYTQGLPIYITENGMASYDNVENGKVNDQARIAYLDQHFQAAVDAIKAGVNLKGYYIWSMLDNFEWALGYDKRFGLVHVDFENYLRTPKQSYHALAKFLAS